MTGFIECDEPKAGKKRGAERTQFAMRSKASSNEHLQAHLQLGPAEGVPAAKNILIKAYRGMTTDQFERFIPF